MIDRSRDVDTKSIGLILAMVLFNTEHGCIPYFSCCPYRY